MGAIDTGLTAPIVIAGCAPSRIPPGADAFDARVIAFDRPNWRPPLRVLCIMPHLGRWILPANSAEQSRVAPKTRQRVLLLGLPRDVVDIASTLAILNKRFRRRAHVAGRREIVAVTTERGDDLLAIHDGKVMALACHRNFGLSD